MPLILSLISVAVILFSFIMWLVISHHFKIFGLREDMHVARFLKVFKIGVIILVFINIILLVVLIVK